MPFVLLAASSLHAQNDVIFQMLLQAWCQHRPVVLSPDAVWMVIEQGFSGLSLTSIILDRLGESCERFRR